ncbi:MAG: peptidylprolyl isomerase, partial [Planctomycetes bacterium]|nr:peptidylprolyl isomerase [Planctomycetota bacterium]
MVDAVLEDAARAAGITVTDEDVVLKVTEAEGQSGGNAGLRAQLARQGVTMAQFREDLRRDLLIGKLLEGRGALKISEDDVRRLYRSQYGERVELAMILVEAEAEAKDVERRLAQGEDFGRLARELSRDTRSWGASGRLGQWGRGDLVPELEEKVFALEPGEVSQPLLT